MVVGHVLAGVDLNLLVVLDALLEERSLTAAGRRVGLSQPAVSHALARLRELLRDEILVRDGRAMRPTALALRIGPTVRRLLGEVESTLLSRQRFDPAGQRAFRIAANDYCGAILLPKLLAQVRTLAPRVHMDVFQEAPSLDAALERGEIDLALGTHEHLEPPLRSATLFEERFVCMLGKATLRGKLTLERFLELDHLLVANPGYGPGVVDVALARRGLQRRVAVRVPHFLVAPAIVEHAPFVVTLPERVARQARAAGHRLAAPPIDLAPFPVQMIWHARTEEEPGARWLREQVVSVARSL